MALIEKGHEHVDDFCVGTLAQAGNVGVIKLAEDLGFSHHGLAEGPLLTSDPYACLALGARDTSTIQLGPYVTNPLTRTPAATANSLSTLNVLAPGRIFAGIGTANNATRSMGVRQARIAEVEEGIQQIRALTRGDRVANEWLGLTRDIQYVCHPEAGFVNVADPIPIWVAAGGPKMLRSAASHADYVVYAAGSDPRMIRIARRAVDDACHEVGRDPSEVKLVALSWFALRRPGQTVQDAMLDGFGNGAVVNADSNINMVRQHADELPEHIVKFSEAAVESYLPQEGDEPRDHLEVFRTHANGIIARRHLEMTTEEAATFWCLWGDYDEIAQRVQEMRDAGADIPSVILGNPLNYERDLRDLSRALNG